MNSVFEIPILSMDRTDAGDRSAVIVGGFSAISGRNRSALSIMTVSAAIISTSDN